MSSISNARTAALEALIDSHAIELKLPTLRRQFRSVAQQAVREQQTPVEYLAALLDAETAERAERREKRRLIDARFPALKRLEDFRFDDNPRIPRATIAALADGAWIENHESVIFVGDSDPVSHCSLRVFHCANSPASDWST
jgi:DNA replication protein DnaC